ncbi:Protein pigeon [Holothuria leucospilota]|uniref:Protein pigeon n=1 Tax=Holothuria leucospilota TaxID=206669 RepID=A0A9Q1CKJ0_HOLLE|nr:Protein pigeon [Holothuria leucospilota]
MNGEMLNRVDQHEKMMQLSCFVDLEDISQEVSDRGTELDLKVVGQEQSHDLILTWNDYLPFSTPKKLVTFVGSYHPSSKQFLKLFVFETQINIIQCSLSPDRCLIAYTTFTKETRGGSEYCYYSAYLAEIHNRVRTCIYSLNLEHTSLIRVQFLWPLRNFGDGDTVTKESRLLAFLHRKSIGLYKINLIRTGSGMVLSNLPVAEQVCGSFMWAQWDKLNQRLYLVVPRTKNSKTKNIFRCLEFTPGGAVPATPVMEMELPFPIKTHHHIERCCYDHDTISQTVSGNSLNMQVITHSQGVFCICYQHVSQTRQRHLKKTTSSPVLRSCMEQNTYSGTSASEPSSPTEPYTLPQETIKLLGANNECNSVTHVDVQYSILCVHKATLISGTIHQVPRQRAKGLRLFFGPQDGYIFVYYPGLVQHLINVTAEFTPCYHIALPKFQENISEENLGYISCERSTHNDGVCLYDVRNLKAFQYSLKKDKVCNTLQWCLSKPFLHFAILQARDSQLSKEIMSHLTQDPTDPGLTEYFVEFIIASTYAAIRKQVDDRDILQCFPFTSELNQQQLLQTQEGERIATFTARSCKYKVDITTETNQNTRKLSHSLGDTYLFRRLKSHLEMYKDVDVRDSQRYTTLPLKATVNKIKQENMPKVEQTHVTEPVSAPQTPNSTFKRATESFRKKLNRSSKKQKKTSSSVSPQAVQESQIVVENEKTEEEWLIDRIQQAHIDAIHKHLQEHVTYASSEKLLQIATAYCSCQVQQTEQLIKVLVRSSGLDEKIIPSVWDTSLTVSASVQEQHLFMLMERLHIAMETQCLQVPKEFPSQFVSLGFRCLEFTLFLQYLHNGVFELSKKFIAKLLNDLPDDDKFQRSRKLKVLWMLPTRKAFIESLKLWNHPEGNAILTRWHLEDIWSSESSRNLLKDQHPESPSAVVRFPPAVSLLKYTEDLGKCSQIPPEKNFCLTSHQIATAALFNSIQKCGEDLRGFTF